MPLLEIVRTERTTPQVCFLARIVGAHFFSPAHVMPLLEIVRTERTAPQVCFLARKQPSVGLSRCSSIPSTRPSRSRKNRCNHR